jgi:hypothetical protein
MSHIEISLVFAPFFFNAIAAKDAYFFLLSGVSCLGFQLRKKNNAVCQPVNVYIIH